MQLTENGIPRSLGFAFQEYQLDKLNPDDDAFVVIERTLAYGNCAELRWLFGQYSRRQIVKWLEKGGWRILPRHRRQFWTIYFDISLPPERGGVWAY